MCGTVRGEDGPASGEDMLRGVGLGDDGLHSSESERRAFCVVCCVEAVLGGDDDVGKDNARELRDKGASVRGAMLELIAAACNFTSNLPSARLPN